MLDALPALQGSNLTDLPDWLQDLSRRLAAAGLGELRASRVTRWRGEDREVTVAAARETPLIARVRTRLARAGIDLSGPHAKSSFVLADLSGLTTEDCTELVRDIHAAGHSSFSVWRRAGETILGPWAEPLRTACWNCCRLRFADVETHDSQAPVAADLSIERAVAENVVLALRHPELVPYGGVVADDGRVSALHLVVPMPWCDVCGGAAALTDLRTMPRAPSPLVPDELSILADARGGVLRELLLFSGDADVAPAMPICASARIAPYQRGGLPRPGLTGEGKGATRDAAVRSAIGEGLERYSASVWDPADVMRTSLNDLGSAAFDPRWLVLYDDAHYEQPGFPFTRFAPDRPLHWTEGRWLDSGRSVQLPALATYMHFPVDNGERFAQVTSNGLAAGVTFEDAALHALYELIERDAFMLNWLAQRSARRIIADDCDPITWSALREVERLGARTELYLLDAGTEHPTVACLGLGDGRSWPGATLGLAAHADIDTALQRAVLEHGHSGAYIRRLMRDRRHEHISTRADVATGLDHALYYVPPSRTASLKALRGGAGPPAMLADLRLRYCQESNLETCVARLGDAGIRVAAVDLTSPDVALVPVRVVRALATHMQPVHFGDANRRLASPRLQTMLAGAPEAEPHPVA